MDISDLVSQALDTPVLGSLVDGLGDVHIQGSSLLENVVERKLADLGTHGGLRELAYGVLCVLDTVGGLVGVKDADVKDTLGDVSTRTSAIGILECIHRGRELRCRR